MVSGIGAVVLIAAIDGAGGSLSTLDLVPGLLIGGLGLGLVVAPMFDIILAAVSDAETGSASGVLNAVQQFAGAAGVAVFGTVFFTVLDGQGFSAAVERTLWIQAGLTVAMLALSPLLPRWAREPAGEGEGTAEPVRPGVAVEGVVA